MANNNNNKKALFQQLGLIYPEQISFIQKKPRRIEIDQIEQNIILFRLNAIIVKK